MNPSLSIVARTTGESFAVQGRLNIHRIYCIGRNYAEHAKEMGHLDREEPFFFQKPQDAIVDTYRKCAPHLTSAPNDSKDDRQRSKFDEPFDDVCRHSLLDSGSLVLHQCIIPYPPMTSSLHHEGELVVAIGKGGLRIQENDALDHVLGYAIGCDLTRRDLQTEAKKLSRPWSVAKGFDFSAPCGPILLKEQVQLQILLSLQVNGQVRQSSLIDNMIWKVPELIFHLSKYFRLKAGDLIFTGTPAGVSSLQQGDNVRIVCGDLVPCEFSIGPPE